MPWGMHGMAVDGAAVGCGVCAGRREMDGDVGTSTGYVNDGNVTM